MPKSTRPIFLDRQTPPHILTLILMAGLSALAMNIFLPSLPGMSEYFDTPYRLMQLSVALYLAVNAVLQILIGPISDKFGRRPVILVGLFIFLLASIGCALSQSVGMFLFFRMMQATIVAAMVLSRAIVRDMVPQDQAASMIGYVTMGMAVVPMLGPVFGGLLDQAFGWQASFWALLVTGALVFYLAWADLGETAGSSGLTLRQQFSEYPVLFRSLRFWGYAVTASLSSGAFFAYLGGAPFVGDHVFKLSPTEVGFYFGVPAIGYFAGNFISGRYSVEVGVNRMVYWGALLTAGGMALNLGLFYANLGSATSFFGLMAMLGLGNGMTIPNATAGALSVRPDLAGTASGLTGALQIGGGAALSALAGAWLTESSGAFPLLWIMLAVSLGAVVTILLVIRREARLAIV